MQTLHGFLPLAHEVVERRRRIVVRHSDAAAEGPAGEVPTSKAESNKAQPPGKRRGKSAVKAGAAAEPQLHVSGAPTVNTADLQAARMKASIFAKDGHVLLPSDGAAQCSVWVPRGWCAEEQQPSWSTTVLYFKPAPVALAAAADAAATSSSASAHNTDSTARQPNTATTAADTEKSEEQRHTTTEGSVFDGKHFISAEAASDPVACLRLTIQDLHSEVGEQTVAEYASDVVSAIYREQTSFVANKYKVTGPKILLDQPLGGGRNRGAGNNNDSDTGATTTTDDEDFSRYQRMFSQRPTLLGTMGSASSSSSLNSTATSQVPKVTYPIGGFTNILSYTTNTVIGRSSAHPKRVNVSCTSLLAIKGRFVYSFELQSSPANHTLPPSTVAPANGNGGCGDQPTADPRLASSSWMSAFLQMAQTLRFDADGAAGEKQPRPDGDADNSATDTDSESEAEEKRAPPAVVTAAATAALPKGTVVMGSITADPHCFNSVRMHQEDAGDDEEEEDCGLPTAKYFTVRSPPLWTPSLSNPLPSAAACRAGGNSAVVMDGVRFRPLQGSQSTNTSPNKNGSASSAASAVPPASTSGTTVMPLMTFKTNSEVFPARIELYVVQTVVGAGVGDSATESCSSSHPAQLAKTSLTETIACLGMQRSYTTATRTLSVGGSDNGAGLEGGTLVTVTPCVVAAPSNVRAVAPARFGFVAGMPPPPAANALNNRRIAVCSLSSSASTSLPAHISSPSAVLTTIVAVEVPLRRNVLKTPCADLAHCVSTVAFADGLKIEAFMQSLVNMTATSSAMKNDVGASPNPFAGGVQHHFSFTLQRHFVMPTMGYAMLVGDGCQVLASPLRSSTASIAVRPCAVYPNPDESEEDEEGDEDSDGASNGPNLRISLYRTDGDTEVYIAPSSTDPHADADEGLVTIGAAYEPMTHTAYGDAEPCVYGGGGQQQQNKLGTRRSFFANASARCNAIAKSLPQLQANANATMTEAMAHTVAELCCELAADEKGLLLTPDRVKVADWLSPMGEQRRGLIRNRATVMDTAPPVVNVLTEAFGFTFVKLTEDDTLLSGAFVPNAVPSSSGGSKKSVKKSQGTNNKSSTTSANREWPAIQSHLRSATDPTDGPLVTMQSVYEGSTDRCVVIKAVSPSVALFRKHCALLMEVMLASFEFY